MQFFGQLGDALKKNILTWNEMRSSAMTSANMVRQRI